MPLPQQLVALVTGASRGVGRGVATGLANAGARVYATGRTIADAQLDPRIVAIPCDHTDDGAVAGCSSGSMARRAGSTCWSTRPGAVRADGRRRPLHVAVAVLGTVKVAGTR